MRLGISSYTYGWAVGAGDDRPADAITATGLIDQAVRMGVGVLQIADNLPESTYAPASVAVASERRAPSTRNLADSM